MPPLFKFGPGVQWAGVAKLVEEMGELQQPLGKLIMVDGKAEAHWSGDLRLMIRDEAADVVAAIHFVLEHNFSPEDLAYVADRMVKKRRQYEEWHREGEQL